MAPERQGTARTVWLNLRRVAVQQEANAAEPALTDSAACSLAPGQRCATPALSISSAKPLADAVDPVTARPAATLSNPGGRLRRIPANLDTHWRNSQYLRCTCSGRGDRNSSRQFVQHPLQFNLVVAGERGSGRLGQFIRAEDR